eukprot:5348334-Amphidinium_carterae.1
MVQKMLHQHSRRVEQAGSVKACNCAPSSSKAALGTRKATVVTSHFSVLQLKRDICKGKADNTRHKQKSNNDNSDGDDDHGNNVVFKNYLLYC